jgi:Spy/CpxP family protein refolding chaperone
VVIVAAGVADTRALAQHERWHHGWPPPVDMVERRADGLLRIVDATPDQKARVHEIIEATIKDIAPLHPGFGEVREQARSILAAPQIDRNALETLRANHLAEMDQLSKRITQAIADVAEVLTPQQRQKLAEVAASCGPPHDHGGHDGPPN